MTSRSSITMKRSDAGRALEDFNAAVAMRPAFWEAYRDKGKLLSWLGRAEEVREPFERSLAIKPGQPEVRDRLEKLRPTW